MKVHILTVFEVVEGETIIPTLMRVAPFYDLDLAQAELKKEYDSCKESLDDDIVEDKYTTSPTGEDRWVLTNECGLTYVAEISTATVD